MTPQELADSLRAEMDEHLAAIRHIADQIEAMDAKPVDVPYRSQWDEDAQAFRSDCGPACVAMLLAHRGIQATIDSLSIGCGLSPAKRSTTGFDLRGVARQRGLNLEIVSGWTLDNFANHLPAIVLVHYGSLPNRIDANYTAGHWVVVTAVTLNTVTFHDPDWWPPRRDEGANRILQRAVFEKAVADCRLDDNPVGYGLVEA